MKPIVHRISLHSGLPLTLLLALLLWYTPAYLRAEPAPAFSLKDGDGNQVGLADYQGRPLILHFWASWCPYCKKLQPGLQRLSAEYEEQGLNVLGINFREDDGVDPQAVLSARGLTFKTLVMGDAAALDYGVRGTPTTFFIDRSGQIIEVSNTSDPDDPILKTLTETITQPTVPLMNSIAPQALPN